MALAPLVALLVFGPSATGSSSPPASFTPPTATTVVAPAPAESTDDISAAQVARDARRAQELLEESQATYRHLDGVTVTMGATPNGEQAVAYYTDGEIVISPTHEASIEDILSHEIWHVIDWRDNGGLDWGEDIPPDNSSDYLR
jgi:hypothetical protein